MQEKLDKLKEARTELGGNEQKQVEALILKLFNATNLASILSAVNITVNGRVFALERLIEVLATVDKVLDTHIDYSDSDITGARLVLTDRTQITFVCNRREQAEGRQVHYVFSTPDWKGVPASFSMIFERRKKEMQMCGRSHVLMTYDGVYHSNIKFDLCEKAGAKPVAEATPPPPPPQAPAPRSKGR